MREVTTKFTPIFKNTRTSTSSLRPPTTLQKEKYNSYQRSIDKPHKPHTNKKAGHYSPYNRLNYFQRVPSQLQNSGGVSETLRPILVSKEYSETQKLHLDCVVRTPSVASSNKLQGNVDTNHCLIGFAPRHKGIINSVGPVWDGYFYTGRRAITDRKMHCFVEIVSTPTADTPGTTLILNFDRKRYLVGQCAEGTQRAAIQRQVKLSKVSDIFLTGPVGWSNMGGLMGMVLTIADSVAASSAQDKLKFEGDVKKGKRKMTDGSGKKGEEAAPSWLNIHGGKNITHALATARRFIFRKGMPIHTQEFRAGETALKEDFAPTWQDDLVKVWAMALESGSQDLKSTEAPAKLMTTIDGKEVTAEDQESIDDQLRKGVISQMFDSDWRLDTLITRKLSEISTTNGIPPQIFFRNSENKIQKYKGPLVGQEENVPDIDVLVRNPWPGALVDNLPPTTPCKTSVCYIMKNFPQRGKFNPLAAKELGVHVKHYKTLTAGESIVTEAGITVTPEQVVAPGKEGGGFAVVDLPDRSFVEALIRRDEWSSKEVMAGVGAIFWILGPGVVEDAKIQAFMKAHPELKHIVSSTDTCSNNLALESPAAAAIRLHLIDPDRFPVPSFNNKPTLQYTDASTPLLYETARAGKKVQLEPKLEVQDDKIVPYLDTAAVVREANEATKGVQELAVSAQKLITDPQYLAALAERQADIPSKDAEVIALGTGSALPSKYRNVSATLVRVPGYGSYLLDCGENTLGQLKRVFGNELPAVLRDLKAIWISHLHADHHLGTSYVIKAWDAATIDDASTKGYKLVVASDFAMHEWLREYSDVERFGYDRVKPIVMGQHQSPSTESGVNRHQHLREFTEEETAACGLRSIETCFVEHCHHSMAVALTCPNGFKIAYSGDCRPSSHFVRIGKNATLLIHEATFDDELQGDAIAKKHSTTAEALKVGYEMNARRILLTHFSQRYQKIPVMNERGGDQVAIVAFDYMRAKVGDFAKVEAFLPALAKLYEESDGN